LARMTRHVLVLTQGVPPRDTHCKLCATCHHCGCTPFRGGGHPVPHAPSQWQSLTTIPTFHVARLYFGRFGIPPPPHTHTHTNTPHCSSCAAQCRPLGDPADTLIRTQRTQAPSPHSPCQTAPPFFSHPHANTNRHTHGPPSPHSPRCAARCRLPHLAAAHSRYTQVRTGRPSRTNRQALPATPIHTDAHTGPLPPPPSLTTMRSNVGPVSLQLPTSDEHNNPHT
jgi:hypothetical protein